MARNKPVQNKTTPVPAKPAANIQQPAAAKIGAGNSFTDGKYANHIIAAVIAVVTFLFYITCLDNKLTNWDDLGYIISNPLIRDSSWEGIKKIFSLDNPVMGNYHPITIMIYAFEYSAKGLEPWIYHFDSIVVHVLTTIAVYYFVAVLTGRKIAAAVTALLFGLHPMHVESVAWAAGRKDLLYGLFYVMSCTTYVRYMRAEGAKKTTWYVLGLALFAISLLCKSVAVSLPVTLFVIDYLEQRKWSLKLVLEKLPHFGFALLFGVLSIFAQKKIGALATLDAHFNPLERLALGAYALCTYLWKAVVPVDLSNFYPYPLKVSDALPGGYYAYLAILLALIFALWKFARHNRVIVFGIGFFIINIFLLLQFLPVGGAIISDRYGYIPYLGLFFVVGWYVSEYYVGPAKKPFGKALLGGVLVYCLVLGYMTTERCKDWRDSLSLWKDNVEKHPEAPVAYFYLGQEYDTRFEETLDPREKQLYRDSAYYYFVQAIYHKPDYTNALICLGELQRSIGQADEARNSYFKALAIANNNETVYLGLGVVYSIKRQFDSAEWAFKNALRLKPVYAEAHSNYANYLDIVGKTDESLVEYATAIAQNPEATIPYQNRARIYMVEKKQFDPAIADYTKVIQLKPDNGEAYYMRSRCYALKGDKAHAIADADKAVELKYPKVDPAYMQEIKR